MIAFYYLCLCRLVVEETLRSYGDFNLPSSYN